MVMLQIPKFQICQFYAYGIISRVTGNEGFGGNFIRGEIIKYKKEWEGICSAENINDTQTLIYKAGQKLRLRSEENCLILMENS